MSKPHYPGHAPEAFYAALWQEIVIGLAQGVYDGWHTIPGPRTSYSRPRPGSLVAQTGEMDLYVERYLSTPTHRLVIGVARTITTTQYRRALAGQSQENQDRIHRYLSRWPQGNRQYPDMTDEERRAWGSLALALNLQPGVLKETPKEEKKTSVLDLLFPTRARKRSA